jgi:FkbM family methyltransferase
MNSKLIYDVGMCEGNDTAFYLHLGYNVIAIEPDPEMVETAKKRFASEIVNGRLTIIPEAISEIEGPQDFYIYENRPGNASLIQHGLKLAKTIVVPTTKFAPILTRYGVPFYLKVDIEGGEAAVLRDLSRNDLPQYISVEMWGIDSICLLHALGYRKFKVVDQPKLENTTFKGWTFKHSSGPFGEDISGDWVPLDGIFLQWLKYLAHEPSTFVDARWHDLHASL